MIKTLAGQVKELVKDSIITPIFMILEAIMEMIIPLLMSSIIDDGVEKGDIHHFLYYYMDGCGSWHRFVCWYVMEESTVQGHQQVLPVIYDRQCLKIFRHFLFPILISSVPQVWLPV